MTITKLLEHLESFMNTEPPPCQKEQRNNFLLQNYSLPLKKGIKNPKRSRTPTKEGIDYPPLDTSYFGWFIINHSLSLKQRGGSSIINLQNFHESIQFLTCLYAFRVRVHQTWNRGLVFGVLVQAQQQQSKFHSVTSVQQHLWANWRLIPQRGEA